MATFDLVWSYPLNQEHQNALGRKCESFVVSIGLPGTNNERQLNIFKKDGANYFRKLILSIITDNDRRFSIGYFKNFNIYLTDSFMNDIEAYDNLISLRGNFHKGIPCLGTPGNTLSYFKGEIIYRLHQNTDRCYRIEKRNYISTPVSVLRPTESIPPPPTSPPPRMISRATTPSAPKKNKESNSHTFPIYQPPPIYSDNGIIDRPYGATLTSRNIIPRNDSSRNARPRVFSTIIETPTNDSFTNESSTNDSFTNESSTNDSFTNESFTNALSINEKPTSVTFTSNSTLKCWNCGKTGHAYTECPNK
jgi:hypothetical protein